MKSFNNKQFNNQSFNIANGDNSTLNIPNSKFKNAQRAPKGELFHSPGHRPGYKEVTNKTPSKGSSKFNN